MLLHCEHSIKKKHDNEADETFVFILDRYHYKLKPSYRNFSKVFSIVSNYRLYLSNALRFQDRILKEFTSGAIYKFQCELWTLQ